MTVANNCLQLLRVNIGIAQIQRGQIGADRINRGKVIRPNLPESREANQGSAGLKRCRVIRFQLADHPGLSSTEGACSKVSKLRGSKQQTMQLSHGNISVQPKLLQTRRPSHQTLQSLEINRTLNAIKHKRLHVGLVLGET